MAKAALEALNGFNVYGIQVSARAAITLYCIHGLLTYRLIHGRTEILHFFSSVQLDMSLVSVAKG